MSMLAIVEMNQCILNLAVKKPAMAENAVHRTTQTTSARIIWATRGMVEKSKAMPKTVPVLGPACMMMVDATMLMPTIRPIDRSVPVWRIRPATPSARNIRGEACWKIFSTF